jgi:hypothetical protein
MGVLGCGKESLFMSPKKMPAVLRRYTSLPSLLHILKTGRITLLNPATWEDRNDVYAMSRFQESKKLPVVLALCFSRGAETYHHWKVYTKGTEGVCIEFKRDDLLAEFEKNYPEVLRGRVTYKPVDRIKRWLSDIDRLPFTKRWQYRHEEEFRLVYLGREGESDANAKGFAVNLDCIRRIQLNPWLPKSMVETVRSTVKSFRSVRVVQTTVLENEAWKIAVRGACKPASKPAADKERSPELPLGR